MNIKQLFKTKDRFYDWPLCVHIYIYIYHGLNMHKQG